MSKSKDKVINEMREITVCNPKRVNIISLLALASSLSSLQTYDNPDLSHDFIQIICRPANFSLSYEQLADVCHYNEKSLRQHCKLYTKIFLHECEHIRRLPLPLLVARLIECKFTTFLNMNISALRSLKYEDIIALISTYPATNQDKRLSIELCEHFFKSADKVAL